ncbi:hypothetical protein AGDE_05616 [Angomonas deanei]|uniref:CS domain containing protein, putative n=1 Tax=Angomonas deanei TaxID=59799 RepID=S9UJ99_9TRYP|eukprot:EPY28834.1 hypothetical protein AGDE_10259 [Angomonas deanei]
MAALFPPLKWAQRPEYVLLTVDLQDAKEVRIQLAEAGAVFVFSCEAGGKSYACRLELYRPVESEESHHVVRPRQVELKLKKKQTDDEEEWPRLTKVKNYQQSFIKVDWSRWKDADEVDEQEDLDDFGMGGDSDFMQKMVEQFKVPQNEVGGETAAGGNEEEDDLPPLEDDY